MSQEKITLRVDLEGIVAERFNRVKKFYGLKNDTELIRYLISQEYRRLFELNM